MMKFLVLSLFTLMSLSAFAEKDCDVRPGKSVGVRVVEFASGNIIHSKMPMKESTPEAILEEMVSLQDMGVCTEKIIAQKCVLKFQKKSKRAYIILYRGSVRWNAWNLSSKENAQSLVRGLKRFGFCS